MDEEGISEGNNTNATGADSAGTIADQQAALNSALQTADGYAQDVISNINSLMAELTPIAELTTERDALLLEKEDWHVRKIAYTRKSWD